MVKGTNGLGGYCLVLAVFVSMLAGLDAAADTTTTVACSTPTSGVIEHLPTTRPFPDALGFSSTFTAADALNFQNPFFENLGTNGRTCGSCHKVDQGWTISPPAIQFLFDLTGGTDPIFNTVDGSNSPGADVSTFQTRRSAYSMLLNRGTIRIGIGIPGGADFELTAVDDPYGFASAAQLSLFRRPLPATNLKFIPAVMWDGRVTGDSPAAALANQATAATQGHAQRPTPLDEATADQIVAFETGLYTAQVFDFKVGRLDINGGLGGAANLANQGIVAARWNLFDAFENNTDPKYQAIYRGQELFNTRRRSTGGGPCQGCHSQSNVGTNVNGTFFNIGTSAGERRAPDQPLYTLTELSTGTVVTTTDPGRALITGKFADVGRFKVPALRALGARAPYFHGGSARTLADVVAFYEESLSFQFTDDEAADLEAFLAAL
jgi:cytochrome c peroxidase